MELIKLLSRWHNGHNVHRSLIRTCVFTGRNFSVSTAGYQTLWINQSHELDLLCDWSFSNNTIWAMIGLCCCIAFIWTVLLVSLCLMHVWLDRTLQFLIFHLYDHRPNWIPRGSFAIIEKGETRLQQKIKKKKINLLFWPTLWHTIAVIKKAHKKRKRKQKAEIKNKTITSSQDLKEYSESALA